MTLPTHNSPELTVSEIAGRVKRVVEENFGYVRVRGEISMAKLNSASGHCYLSLKDDKAVLDAVCWKGTYQRLAHKPQAGLEVIAIGKLTTYPGSSKYQLVIEALEPAGVGALMAMLEERKKKLAAEGLFAAERKKPLPFLPTTIGIITSPTGAVIRDILHRLGDRFPRHVLLWPVPVQGAGAAEKIAEAIAGFNSLSEGGRDFYLPTQPSASSAAAQGCPPSLTTFDTPAGSRLAQSATHDKLLGLRKPDVIIVARGGGSIEDLWCFNEEIVVRAAAASAIPLISAVGHETDTTLIDYAADRRAPTPTAAAEMAVPVRGELLAKLEMMGAAQTGAMQKLLRYHTERVEGMARGLPRPAQLVAGMEQLLDSISERLGEALPRMLERKTEMLRRVEAGLSPLYLRQLLQSYEQRVAHMGSLLESLNVLKVLQRGFALVKDAQGAVVKNASAVTAGANLTLQFHDGEKPVVVGGAIVTTKARKPKSTENNQSGLFD